ncbi:MAG: Asp-tRNA(Asn)/Glu-tRNA(Gln) amidotransferase subunit GatC [Parahaliea sp.]
MPDEIPSKAGESAGPTIDPAAIADIAELARIRIDENQLEDVAHRFSSILAMVDTLKAAAITDVEPMANPLDAIQTLRPDEVTEINQREAFQTIAPATAEGLYLVPKVIE